MGLTRQEKEELVLKLYNQGKSYHEIAKEARVSLRDIGPILNRGGVQQGLSNSSRAYRLFHEGESPVMVAIHLNLREEDVTKYYTEYWKLRHLRDLYHIYEEIKDDIRSLIDLYQLMKSAKMDIQNVIKLLKIANNDLPSVENRNQELERRESILKASVQRSARALQEISDRTSMESKTLEQHRSIYNQIKEKIEDLNTKKARLESIIDSFHNNSETYDKIKQMIQQEIESIITNPRRLLQFALASIFESTRKHPGRLQAMYYNMPTIRTMGRSSSTNAIGDSPYQDNQYEQYLSEYAREYDAWENMLLNEAEQLYNRMIGESMNMCSNEMTSNTESSLHQSMQPLAEPPEVQHGQATEEDHYSNSDVAEPDLLTTKVVCNKTDQQIQYEENNVDVPSGCIRVGKNEIYLRI